MKTTTINGKKVPVLEPKEIVTTISNLKTGETYKTEEEWKLKGIDKEDIRRDVKVMMPDLAMLLKT